jgi:hypothetical protein
MPANKVTFTIRSISTVNPTRTIRGDKPPRPFLMGSFSSRQIGEPPDPPMPDMLTREEVVARRRERAQRYAAKHHTPPAPSGPPDPPTPTEAALLEIVREMERQSTETRAMLAEWDRQLAEMDDDTPIPPPDGTTAGQEHDGDAMEARVAEMAAHVLAIGELAEDWEGRVEAAEEKVTELVGRLSDVHDLLDFADVTDDAEMTGEEFAAVVARFLELGRELAGPIRAVASQVDAGTEPEQVAAALRRRALDVLRPAKGE